MKADSMPSTALTWAPGKRKKGRPRETWEEQSKERDVKWGLELGQRQKE